MRPIIQATIPAQNFAFDNFKTPFDFTCSVFRSIAFKNQICALSINNFLTPFIDDLSIRKAMDKDTIVVQAGYQKDGKNLLENLCNGRVIYYKQVGYNFEIHFVEGQVESLYADQWLTSCYPLAQPMQASWSTILQAIYPAPKKIRGLELVGAEIGMVGNDSMYNILTEFSDATGLLWYFANEELNIVDVSRPGNVLNIHPWQKSGGAQLQTTNPWLILDGLSPLARLNRVWALETIFGPAMRPGAWVSFLDNLGNTRQGYIGTVRNTVSTAATSSRLTVIETVDNTGVAA
ncbi:MAG: hypothetical protein NC548_32280 [Lachnospiraceae bacterium]|nr:hypothetical protein [Lachnospiraceae bacterium]